MGARNDSGDAMNIEIKILREAGYDEAIKGMEFSYETECLLSEVDDNHKLKSAKVALFLADKDRGHNKFLESIQVWMDIRATMNWWKQFDTYRIGVTKLSKSTMHTLMKRPIVQTDFGTPIPIGTLVSLNSLRKENKFEEIINILPMGYLQTRRVCLNYKTIRGIILQRRGHKLPEWKLFIKAMENLSNFKILGV
jgi:hypothetical protein